MTRYKGDYDYYLQQVELKKRQLAADYQKKQKEIDDLRANGLVEDANPRDGQGHTLGKPTKQFYVSKPESNNNHHRPNSYSGHRNKNNFNKYRDKKRR